MLVYTIVLTISRANALHPLSKKKKKKRPSTDPLENINLTKVNNLSLKYWKREMHKQIDNR